MSPEARLRILVADDHALVRDGLTRLLNDQEDMAVVAEAGDGAEAVRLASSVRPAIALVDVSMPGWDGMKIADALVRKCPDVRILAVTRHKEPEFVRRMLAAGARGYILKQSSIKELIHAIREVARGFEYIDPALTPLAIPSPHRPPNSSADTDSEALTEVEEQVLRLLADAQTVQEVGARLGMSSDQAMDLKLTAMRKAGVFTRLQTVAYARARGWM